ncbi:hypothetical protein D3C74_457810 [compost metagenome]
MPDAKSASSAVFVDIDAIEKIARANIDALGGDDSWISYVAPLQAFGVSTRVDGGHAVSSVRLSFD